MKKNVKYQSFGAGRAGQGNIDLQNGKIEFTHGDVNSDANVLPLNISHVYSTAAVKDPNGSVVYGKGFRLNLHQNLQKVVKDDPKDTRYILSDAAYNECEFKEVYYYINAEGKKEYGRSENGEEIKFSPEDISIGLDGKLTYVDETGTEHEIFSEIKTDGGLTLTTTELKGFRGAEKIEARAEELRQLEEDIKTLRKSIEDCEYYIPEYDKLNDERYLDLKVRQIDIQNLSSQIEVTDQTQFNALISQQDALMASSSSPVEKQKWADQKIIRLMKGNLLDLQAAFQNLKNSYDEEDEEKTKGRYAVLLERSKNDLINARNLLEYKEFSLKEYREQVAVNYISDKNNMTYGFNEYGNMVLIWDAYDNYVSLIYENGNITKIVDAEEKEILFEYADEKLSFIIDSLDRRTSFFYNGDELERVVYPNGDASRFTYQNHVLFEIMPPTGIGLRLECDYLHRPLKISNITSIECISIHGISESQNIQTEDLVQITYNSSGTSTYVRDIKTNYRTTYIFNSEGEWVTEYTDLDGVMESIKTYDIGESKCCFTMQQTEFDKDLIHNGSMRPHGSNVILAQNGDLTIQSTGTGSERFAEWNVDIGSLPEHATDLILSGFATADSCKTTERRKTEYCDCVTDDTDNPTLPRFELRAVVTYLYPAKTKTFIASYDWKTKTKQFAAIPITLDEYENGEPRMPDSIRIFADYSNNQNECTFSKPSLANGNWHYVKTNNEKRKIFECSNRNIYDRTVDGVKEGTFVTYGETFYDYDEKGNLVEERSVVNKNGDCREFITKHEYDKRSNLIRTISHNGMISENVYDKQGNIVKSLRYHRSNPSTKFIQETEISEKGQVTGEIDERGENRTKLRYVNGTNILSSIVSPDGQELSLGLDPQTDDLVAISASVQGEPNQTKFDYTKDVLTRLSSGGTEYDYSYDLWGRNNEIRVASQPHVRFAFETDNSNGNEIVRTTYANNEEYETVTDKFGKLLKVDRVIDGIKTPYISYNYDKRDRLIRVIDHLSEKTTEYVYNEGGSLNHERSGDIVTTTDRNIDGAPEKVKFVISDIGEQVYRNVYDSESKLSEILLPNNKSEAIEYDILGRVVGIEHPAHSEKIVYYQNGSNATNIVSSTYQNNDRTRYTYDSNGNIIEIRENNRLSVRYGYDGLSRLIREDNVRLGKSFTFDYDTNGNILFKNEYRLTFNRYLREYPDDLMTGLGLPAGSESEYVYAKDGNRDRLISFNGESCEYDELGNPVIYRNKVLKWNNLTNLTEFDGVSFRYSAIGPRSSKTYNGKETKFYWSGSQLLAERRTERIEDIELGDHLTACTNGCSTECEEHTAYANASVTEITYLQGADGPTGFTVSKNNGSDETYYYRKNTRGDITHISDGNGSIKAEYVYDAWGNHEIIKNEDNIGNINPLRYRGYYYDDETGLYYLKARYYDPQTGRFISADDVGVFEETSMDINGLNLYIYCGDNPVMFYDPTGQLSWGILGKVANAVVGTAAGAVNSVCKVVSNTIDDVANWVDENRDLIITAVVIVTLIALTVATCGVGGAVAGAIGMPLLGSIIGGAVAGAIGGAMIGAGMSIISQGMMNGYDNIDWGNVGKEAAIGAISGAALGGIGGAAGGGVKAVIAGRRATLAGKVYKIDNVTVRMVENSELTREAQIIRAGLPKTAQGHTISNMGAGQKMHTGFMSGMPGKEATISGVGRADVLTESILIELKPNNPRAIREGIKQLRRYNSSLDYKREMILVLY